MNTSIAYIVTGNSRGLGLALAEEILARGQWLYTISRQPDKCDDHHINVACDLREGRHVSRAIMRILEEIDRQSFEALVLINNAGVLEPIGPVERLSFEAVQDSFGVNLLAPVHLAAAFIRGTHGFSGERRIINISSGAAHSPYAGWSLYCAAKAALNSFSACVALENEIRQSPVSMCTVAPGILDTDMQSRIRATSPNLFPMRSKFVTLYKEDRLSSPRRAAKHLLDLDAAGRLRNGGHFDLRSMADKSQRIIKEEGEN